MVVIDPRSVTLTGKYKEYKAIDAKTNSRSTTGSKGSVSGEPRTLAEKRAGKVTSTEKNPIVNKKTGETLSQAIEKLRKNNWSEKDIQAYKDRVKQEFDQWYGNQISVTLTEEEMNHVIDVGVSVLQTRDGGMQGGSFVQAVVDNDLSRTYNRADSVNKRVIPFYIILLNHVLI